ncbi:hypothetical protein NMY22_g11248 [Coprinellus aureogranulatus]|nr:hypothetical protein NMY22_g11248 [Coprinellus aureogranulatus]
MTGFESTSMLDGKQTEVQALLYSKPPPKRSGLRKFIYVSLTALFLLFVVYEAQKQVRHISQLLGRPYPQLFSNATSLAQVEDVTTVVRPLVDEETKFDVVATVRVREGMKRRRLRDRQGSQGREFCSMGWFSRVTEEALDNYDLRATFTLVPQSPSLLDRMTGSTTWFPHIDLNKLIVQPESAQCHADRSITNKQIATAFFSVTTPLIEFNPIKSACGKDGDGVRWEAEDVEALHHPGVVESRGRPALQAHPYVITRTDLRVVRMTDLYNLHSYMMLHKALGLNETNPMQCPPRLFTKPTIEDLWNCKRTFRGVGNTEVGIKVSVPDEKSEDGGRNVTVLAYAPYMEAVYRSWGPLDLVPIPVNREQCDYAEKTATGMSKPRRYYKPLRVVWNIAFSATSPARLDIAHLLAGERRYNVTDNEYDKAVQQMKIEKISTVGGHRFHLGNRLYERWFVDEISGYLFPVARILYVAYWMLLTSTEGISVLGSVLLSISYILPLASELLPRLVLRIARGKASFTFDVKARGAIALGIWKVLSGLRVTRTFPFVGRRKPTQGEVESRRIERSSLGVCFVVLGLAAFVLTLLDEVYQKAITIIPRVGPAPDCHRPSDTLGHFWSIFKPVLVNTLFLIGEFLQLSLNYRQRRFAGRQKVVAFIVFLAMVLRNLVYYLKWIGEGEGVLVREPLTMLGVVYLVVAAVWAWQAVVYPYHSAGQEESEETSGKI